MFLKKNKLFFPDKKQRKIFLIHTDIEINVGFLLKKYHKKNLEKNKNKKKQTEEKLTLQFSEM